MGNNNKQQMHTNSCFQHQWNVQYIVITAPPPPGYYCCCYFQYLLTGPFPQTTPGWVASAKRKLLERTTGANGYRLDAFQTSDQQCQKTEGTNVNMSTSTTGHHPLLDHQLTPRTGMQQWQETQQYDGNVCNAPLRDCSCLQKQLMTLTSTWDVAQYDIQ